jgi:uncharacterized protein YecE (DUF72 family)
MTEQTPDGFQFIVKLPRLLSHDRNVTARDTFRIAVTELKRRGRLLGLLAQFPQSVHFDGPSQRWIEALGHDYKGFALAVEFRHDSWDRPEVPLWLAEHDITLVSPDVADLPGLYPRGLRVSGPRIYIRLHSRNRTWHTSSRGRYDYLYTRQELAEWVVALKPHVGRVQDVLFVFNNCYGGQAIENARMIRELLRKRIPDIQVVEPVTTFVEDRTAP